MCRYTPPQQFVRRRLSAPSSSTFSSICCSRMNLIGSDVEDKHTAREREPHRPAERLAGFLLQRKGTLERWGRLSGNKTLFFFDCGFNEKKKIYSLVTSRVGLDSSPYGVMIPPVYAGAARPDQDSKNSSCPRKNRQPGRFSELWKTAIRERSLILCRLGLFNKSLHTLRV